MFVLEKLGLVKGETQWSSFMTLSLSALFLRISLTDSSEICAKVTPEGTGKILPKDLLHSFNHKRWDLLIRLTLLTYFRTEPHLHPGTASPEWFEQALLTVSSNRLSGFNIWLSFPQVHDQAFSFVMNWQEHCAPGSVCGEVASQAERAENAEWKQSGWI